MKLVSPFTHLPIVFSCGDQTRHIPKDPSTALDDGERVGLTSVRQCTDQEAQSAVHRTDGHLVVDAVSRQIPQSAQETLQGRLLGTTQELLLELIYQHVNVDKDATGRRENASASCQSSLGLLHEMLTVVQTFTITIVHVN